MLKQKRRLNLIINVDHRYQHSAVACLAITIRPIRLTIPSRSESGFTMPNQVTTSPSKNGPHHTRQHHQRGAPFMSTDRDTKMVPPHQTAPPARRALHVHRPTYQNGPHRTRQHHQRGAPFMSTDQHTKTVPIAPDSTTSEARPSRPPTNIPKRSPPHPTAPPARRALHVHRPTYQNGSHRTRQHHQRGAPFTSTDQHTKTVPTAPENTTSEARPSRPPTNIPKRSPPHQTPPARRALHVHRPTYQNGPHRTRQHHQRGAPFMSTDQHTKMVPTAPDNTTSEARPSRPPTNIPKWSPPH